MNVELLFLVFCWFKVILSYLTLFMLIMMWIILTDTFSGADHLSKGNIYMNIYEKTFKRESKILIFAIITLKMARS